MSSELQSQEAIVLSKIEVSQASESNESESNSLDLQLVYEGLDTRSRMRYKMWDDFEWKEVKGNPSTSNSFNLQGVPQNSIVEYQWWQDSTWSKISRFHTLNEALVQNITANEGAEEVKLNWSVFYGAAKWLANNNAQAFIEYNTDIRKKRHENGMEESEWYRTDTFPLIQGNYHIKNLIGNEKYHFKIGLILPEELNEVVISSEQSNVVYSATIKAKTLRAWGVVRLLILIGSLGFFIYGMKVMSEGLQQAAGNFLRSMLNSITANRVKGVFTGFGITAIAQSSSVTTVMTVSFVNAGLMTLRQSAGVMMGANIGTTITAWIILLLGFKVSIGSYAYMLLALAFPLLFIKKGKAKSWASAIVGFCILFIGLGALKEAVPELDKDSAIVHFFLDYKDAWYGSIMFVLLGALVTIIIQSSSAAMALTLALVAKGAIPFEVACAMVLGENIGTTITAELASLIANVHAKRSARVHSLFNVIGVSWMLLIFPFFLELVGYLVGVSEAKTFDPTNTDMIGTGIALFHTLFNLANVVLLIWFVPQLVLLAYRSVRSKGAEDDEYKLDFIGGPLGSTAELRILEAKKEVSKFGTVAARMTEFVRTILNTSSRKKKNALFEKLEKYEQITDRVEIEIADYLGKAARLEMSEEASVRMRGMLSIANDLERTGDVFYQMSRTLEKKDKDKIYFTPEQRSGLNNMLDLLDEAFVEMNKNLESDKTELDISLAIGVDKKIKSWAKKLTKQHHKMIESGDYHIQGTLMFASLYSSMEKVSDHIINVSRAAAGEV